MGWGNRTDEARAVMSRFKQFPFGTAVVLSCTLAWAAELPAPVESSSFIEPGELAAMSLSIVDQKLALSLAVETHVQIDMVKYALSEIDDPALRQLAEKRLRLYEQLFTALDALTEDRASRLLTATAGLGIGRRFRIAACPIGYSRGRERGQCRAQCRP